MSVFGPSVETLGYSQMSLRDKSWPVNGYPEFKADWRPPLRLALSGI